MGISRIISVAAVIIPFLAIVGCDSDSTSNASSDTIESLPDSSEEVEALPDSTESPESSSSSKSPKSSNSEPPQSSNGAQDKSSNSVTPKSSNSAQDKSSNSATPKSSNSAQGKSSSSIKSSSGSNLSSSSSAQGKSSSSATDSSEVIKCGSFIEWEGDSDRIDINCDAGGNTSGYWYVFDNSLEGDKSYIEWPVPLYSSPYEREGIGPMITVTDFCNGLCGQVHLDTSFSHDPFVGVAFDFAGEVDHRGSGEIALADVTNYQGVCVTYASDLDIFLELSLGEDKNNELGMDLPATLLPKSTDPTAMQFKWSQFKQGNWKSGEKITGDEAAMAAASLRFKFKAMGESEGFFHIWAVGPYGSGCEHLLQHPLAFPW